MTANFCLSFLPLPAQNDHLATNGQAEDLAEQSEGVPSEIHPAVFLDFHICYPTN